MVARIIKIQYGRHQVTPRTLPPAVIVVCVIIVRLSVQLVLYLFADTLHLACLRIYICRYRLTTLLYCIKHFISYVMYC